MDSKDSSIADREREYRIQTVLDDRAECATPPVPAQPEEDDR